MKANLQNPIAAAVEPRRAAAVERAKEAARAVSTKALEILAENGWNLSVVAPNANSNMSRRDYQTAKAKRAFFISLTRSANDDSALNAVEVSLILWKRHRNQAADLVAADQDSIERYILASAREADLEFSSYISKLTRKVNADAISEVVAAGLDAGTLWSFSHLTVTRADGSTERWRTQMIINVSVLGKLFNQWPTRRVK